jgi:hypothetical protein
LLSVLSLLLCVAVGGLGVRSFWRFDRASANWLQGSGYDGEHTNWFVYSNRGALTCARGVHRYYRSDTTGEAFPVWPGVRYSAGSAPAGYGPDPRILKALRPPGGAYLWGFGAGRYVGRSSSPDGNWSIRDDRMVLLPHWAAALLFLLAAAPLLARVRRAWRLRRRLRRHLCLQCGYDLRASESLCPECGRAIADAC